MLYCLIITAALAAAVDEIDVNSPETIDVNVLKEAETDVKEALAELKTRHQELEVKTYIGTIDDVLSQRSIDVNEAAEFAAKIPEDANKVVEGYKAYYSYKLSQEPTNIEAKSQLLQLEKNQSATVYIIEKSKKIEGDVIDTRKQNVEFLKAVEMIWDDPNAPWNDPNDPNYPAELAMMNEFRAVCYEIADPR